jgi:hypothetical protein
MNGFEEHLLVVIFTLMRWKNPNASWLHIDFSHHGLNRDFYVEST